MQILAYIFVYNAVEVNSLEKLLNIIKSIFEFEKRRYESTGEECVAYKFVIGNKQDLKTSQKSLVNARSEKTGNRYTHEFARLDIDNWDDIREISALSAHGI